MAQLIQMRQRIKAIETIKKVTHAMRLISMSMHTRLRNKKQFLNEYNRALTNLLHKVQKATTSWNNPLFKPTPESKPNELIILISSQKGLCGAFNLNLFNRFENNFAIKKFEHTSFITVGKRATEYIAARNPHNIVKAYDYVASHNIAQITNLITNEILKSTTPFTSITVLGNEAKSFFFQKPITTQIIPFVVSADSDQTALHQDDYQWHQSPQETLDIIAEQYLESQIYNLIFESLLAEQAARFLSMDSSTRNAKKLLEETRLQYNKLRQAKITKELAELTGSFS